MLVCSECDSRSSICCPAVSGPLRPARPALFHRPTGSRPAQKPQRRAFVSPLFATLTHSLSRKSFPCHSYANTRDGGYHSPIFFSQFGTVVYFHALTNCSCGLSIPREPALDTVQTAQLWCSPPPRPSLARLTAASERQNDFWRSRDSLQQKPRRRPCLLSRRSRLPIRGCRARLADLRSASSGSCIPSVQRQWCP